MSCIICLFNVFQINEMMANAQRLIQERKAQLAAIVSTALILKVILIHVTVFSLYCLMESFSVLGTCWGNDTLWLKSKLPMMLNAFLRHTCIICSSVRHIHDN